MDGDTSPPRTLPEPTVPVALPQQPPRAAAAVGLPTAVGAEFVARIGAALGDGRVELIGAFGRAIARTGGALPVGEEARFRVMAPGPPPAVVWLGAPARPAAGSSPATTAAPAADVVRAAVTGFANALRGLPREVRAAVDPGGVARRVATLLAGFGAAAITPAGIETLATRLGHDLERRLARPRPDAGDGGPAPEHTAKAAALRVLAADADLAPRVEPARAAAAHLVRQLAAVERDELPRAQRNGYESIPLPVGADAGIRELRLWVARRDRGRDADPGRPQRPLNLVVAVDLDAFGPLRVDIEWRAVDGIGRVRLGWTAARPGVAEWLAAQVEDLAVELRAVGIELDASTVAPARPEAATVTALCAALCTPPGRVDVHA